MRLRAFALLVALTVAAPLVHADDRKYVALLEFEGPGAQSVRGDVMRSVATRAWVSSSSNLDGRSVREFALDNEIDVVIEGSVRKARGGYEIRIRFLRGSTGRAITTATTWVRRPMVDRASKQRIERELAKALAATTAFVRP